MRTIDTQAPFGGKQMAGCGRINWGLHCHPSAFIIGMSAVGVNSSMRPEMVGLGNNLVKARPRLATIQLQESPGSQGYALVPISAGILRVGYPFNAKTDQTIRDTWSNLLIPLSKRSSMLAGAYSMTQSMCSPVTLTTWEQAPRQPMKGASEG